MNKKCVKLIIASLMILLGLGGIAIESHAATMSEVNFSKTSDWDSMEFTSLTGDNLSENQEVTSKTSALEIRKKMSPDFSYDIMIIDDHNDFVTKAYIPRGSDRTTISLVANALLENKKYSIVVHLKNQWDQLVGIFGIARFTVGSVNVAHQPPVITASDRIIAKDTPDFDIMAGVHAVDESGQDITAEITVSGEVNVAKEGIYPISYSVTDNNGLSATQRINITVEGASLELLPPTLDIVTDTDLIVTGHGMSGKFIYVTLGTEVYRETITTEGSFTIKLEKTYAVGTGITAYIQDNQGNQSEKLYEVVQAGNIAVGVNKIVSSDKEVTGHTTPNAQIEVEVHNTFEGSSKGHIYEGVSDANGDFIVSLHNNTYPAGTAITVVVKKGGQGSSAVSVIVYPKKVTLNTVAVGDRVISGQGDPNALIHIKINEKLYDFQANAAGYFFGDIAFLQKDDRIFAYQTSNNITGETIELIVSK